MGLVIDRVVVLGFPNESSYVSQAPQTDFSETGRGKHKEGSRFLRAMHILPSLPRVINFKFPLQPQQSKYYITQYEELGSGSYRLPMATKTACSILILFLTP